MKYLKTILISAVCISLVGCSSAPATEENTNSNSEQQLSSESTSSTSTKKEETKDNIEIQDEIIEAAEDFLEAYYEYDTADYGGVYDIREIYKQYENMLTDAGKSALEPDSETQPDTVDVEKHITDMHTYVSQKDNSTATTVSLFWLEEDVGGFQTHDVYLVNLFLKKSTEDGWLIELPLNTVSLNSLNNFDIERFY